MSARAASRWGLAACAAAAVFVASYVAQRLWSLSSEPGPAQAVASSHIPLYWRTALALLQAATAASMIGLGLDEVRAEAILRRAPLWLPAIVLPLALLMALFP